MTKRGSLFDVAALPTVCLCQKKFTRFWIRMCWKSRLDYATEIAWTTVRQGQKAIDMFHIETYLSSRTGGPERERSENRCRVALWWRSEACSLTRTIGTPVLKPKEVGESEACYFYFFRTLWWKNGWWRVCRLAARWQQQIMAPSITRGQHGRSATDRQRQAFHSDTGNPHDVVQVGYSFVCLYIFLCRSTTRYLFSAFEGSESDCLPIIQCCGSMTFWCGPGSADPCLKTPAKN